MRFSPGSLRLRTLLVSTLVLAGFLVLTGLALVEAYAKANQEAQRQQLLGFVYTILSSAKETEQGLMRMPESLLDARLNQTDSGIYAEVLCAKGGRDYLWSSPSLLGRGIRLARAARPGEILFTQQTSDDEPALRVDFGVNWEGYRVTEDCTVSVLMSLTRWLRQREGFQRQLWQALALLAALLLIVQIASLNWSLSPLRRITHQLHELENGRVAAIDEAVPDELQALVNNINSLNSHIRKREQRYKNSLGDLAHSLKTPLAVIHATLNEKNEQKLNYQDNNAMLKELAKIDAIVQRQLTLASASAQRFNLAAIKLAHLVDRIAGGLQKVYRDKEMLWSNQTDADLTTVANEADLMEILGNLMDNAWKYGRSRVLVSAIRWQEGIRLSIEDDGPGLGPEVRALVLRRGWRAEQNAMPGQGLGLSLVSELVDAYEGKLTIDRSDRLGGSAFQVWLPD